MAKQSLITEFRNMEVLELIKKGEEKRAQLFALKFQATLGSLEQTHKIKEIKKEIARIELVLSEKRLNGENTNSQVKIKYNEAVLEAEKATKEARKIQRQMLEDLQKQEAGSNDLVEDQNNQTEVKGETE